MWEKEAEQTQCCSAQQQRFHIVLTTDLCTENTSRDNVKGESASGKKGVKMSYPINGPHSTFVKSFLCLTVMLAIIGMTVIKATLSPRVEIIPLTRSDLFSDHITPVMKSAF